MPLEEEPWRSYGRSGDKVAKIARALSQDVGKNIKKMLRHLYPKKEIQNKANETVDIGEESTDWHYIAIVFFGEDLKVQKDIIDQIGDAYEGGYSLNDDKDFLEEISDATPLISKEMRSFAQIPRLAFKDTLVRESTRRSIHATRWE